MEFRQQNIDRHLDDTVLLLHVLEQLRILHLFHLIQELHIHLYDWHLAVAAKPFIVTTQNTLPSPSLA